MKTLIRQYDISGIGYEGQNIDEFVARLAVGGTRILADVRLNPISRKRGFSKRLLAASLAEAGIGYRHVPELGNPKLEPGRIRRKPVRGPGRAGSGSRDMLDGEAAGLRLNEIADAAIEGGVAVMCFEADERACHRYVVLRELAAPPGVSDAVAL